MIGYLKRYVFKKIYYIAKKKNETFCPIHYMHTVTDLQLPDNKMQPGASCNAPGKTYWNA